MTSRCSAAIFDMDGTLIDSMNAWRSLGPGYLAERGVELAGELPDWKRTSTRAAAQMIARLLPDAPPADEVMAQLLARLPAMYREVLPKPGAIEWLDALAARGVPMCVATASPFSREVLDRLGITPKMRFIADERDLGIRKSEPAFFIEVARRMGVPPQQCAVYEDALYAARSAKLAGCQVIAIEDESAIDDREALKALTDRYITSYDELLAE